jgi:Ca2+:H+ antiporter
MTANLRLAAAWATVIIFFLAGPAMMAGTHPVATGVLFVWLLGIVVWAAFGVVHEAEEIAERLGEPFGTLVLTLSIVIIEVALISAVMLGPNAVPTLGRDTMFAVLMIVLNGVVGLCLLVGGLRYHQQSYNLQGASAYLALIVPLSVIALVLPNFTTSAGTGMLSVWQAGFFSIFTLALYGLFLWLQTGRHRGFFVPASVRPGDDVGRSLPHYVRAQGRTTTRVFLLFANLLPIIILSKSLATMLDGAILLTGAPPALGGIIIAMIVFTPEGMSALKAVAANQLTRAINLCLGAATSTLGLTIPAVLLIGLLSNQPVELGLSPANMVLLAVTLMLNTLTFSGTRTTMLEGATHLALFFVFLVLVFSP